MAFTLLQLSAALLAFFYSLVLVNAESHTVRFNNKCGHGTPMLIRGPDVLSKGPDYTSNGPLSSAIAYLQTGNCGFNGENCAIVEFTLNNPTCAGCGSSTDISLISPHGFNVETGFSYFGGCDGSGATCNSGSCSSAFFKPDDNQVQVACQDNNVNLEITFCGSGSSNNDEAPASPEHSSSKAPVPASSSVKVAPVKATPPPVQFTTTIHAIPTSKAPVSQPSPVVSSSAEDSTATPVSPSAQTSSVPPRCRPGSSRRRRSLEQIETVNETRTVPRRHHRRLSRQHISPVAITV